MILHMTTIKLFMIFPSYLVLLNFSLVLAINHI